MGKWSKKRKKKTVTRLMKRMWCLLPHLCDSRMDNKVFVDPPERRPAKRSRKRSRAATREGRGSESENQKEAETTMARIGPSSCTMAARIRKTMEGMMTRV